MKYVRMRISNVLLVMVAIFAIVPHGFVLGGNTDTRNSTTEYDISLHRLFNTNQLALITLRSGCRLVVEATPTTARRCPLGFQHLASTDELRSCAPTRNGHGNVHMHLVPPGTTEAELQKGASLLFVWLGERRLEARMQQIRFPQPGEEAEHLDFTANDNSLFSGSAGTGAIARPSDSILHTVFDPTQRLLYVWLSDQRVRIFQIEETGNSMGDGGNNWSLLSLRILKAHDSLADVERIVADAYSGEVFVVRRSRTRIVTLQSLPISRLSSFLAHGANAVSSLVERKQVNCNPGESAVTEQLCDTHATLHIIRGVVVSSTISDSAVRTRVRPLDVTPGNQMGLECRSNEFDGKGAWIQSVAVLDDIYCGVRDGVLFSRAKCEDERIHFWPDEQNTDAKHQEPVAEESGISWWMIVVFVLLVVIVIILLVVICWVCVKLRSAMRKTNDAEHEDSRFNGTYSRRGDPRLISNRPIIRSPTNKTGGNGSLYRARVDDAHPPQPYHMAGPNDYGRQASANLDVTVDGWWPPSTGSVVATPSSS